MEQGQQGQCRYGPPTVFMLVSQGPMAGHIVQAGQKGGPPSFAFISQWPPVPPTESCGFWKKLDNAAGGV